MIEANCGKPTKMPNACFGLGLVRKSQYIHIDNF